MKGTVNKALHWILTPALVRLLNEFQVSIDYKLKGSVLNQRAEIVIYNIRGQVIRRVQGTQGNATIDVSDLKTGVYLYQLKTDNYQKTRKMIVVK